MVFAKRLAMLREEKSMSRRDLAKALNISYSSVSKYETDVRFPDQETLKAIADVFQVSIDYLLGRTDIRNFYEKSDVIEKDCVLESGAHDSYYISVCLMKL